MEFVVEMLITAFTLGGVIGAVIALHLSSNLKEAGHSRTSTPATLELPRNNDPAEPKPVPIDIASRRADVNKRRR